jgi:hypothetical protein
MTVVSSPCQRQGELLPSLGVRCPSSFVRRLSSINDRDEMCNRYGRPSIVASFQVSVHFAKQFERRRFDKIGLSFLKAE